MNVKRFPGGLVCKAHRLVCHSALGSRVMKKRNPELYIFIDNLLVRIHLIIEMILVDRPCATGV